MTNGSAKPFDIAVIGGGLAGLTASIASAKLGLDTLLVAPRPEEADPRTTAIFETSLDLLAEMSVIDDIRDHGYPLKTMRIVDGTQRLFRAPQTDFSAAELGLPAFGYNFANAFLLEKLEQVLEAIPNLTRVTAPADEIMPGQGQAKIRAGGKTYHAKLLVGSDGRHSPVRNALGITTRDWSYPQTAIVLDFEHAHGSEQTSTEFHTESGPFTIVPKAEHMAGLVWVERPEVAEQIVTLSKAELEVLIEEKMHSYLGPVKLVSKVERYPLSGLVANRFGRANAVLVGEAAHVFPPIGAQGFNLGIRDIHQLHKLLRAGVDSGQIGERYHEERRQDVNRTTTGVDLLNRTLLSGFLPVQVLRAGGLFALGSVPGLRKLAMRAGISAQSPLGHIAN